MQDILFHPYFKNIAVPIGTAILTVIIKSVSKAELQKSIEKKDLAIGLDLCVTSLTVFATGMVDLLSKYSGSELTKNLRESVKTGNTSEISVQDLSKHLFEVERLQEKFAVSLWIAFGLSLGTFSIAFLIRKYGWDKNTPPGIADWTGIIIPNIVGILSLIGVVTWMGN